MSLSWTKNFESSQFHQPCRHSLIYDDAERRRRKIRGGRSDKEPNFLKAATASSSSSISPSVLKYFRISHLFFLYVIFNLVSIYYFHEICFLTSFSCFSLFFPPLHGRYNFLTFLVSAQIYPSPFPPSSSSSSNPLLGGVCNAPYFNPCEIESTCIPSVPIVGQAICKCMPGYKGDGRKLSLGGEGCSNIDECKDNVHNCNLNVQKCVDTMGLFRCECRKGYTLAPDGKTCIDVDECAKELLHTCNLKETKCINVEGSFKCDCLEETKILDPATGQCRDMNECKDKNGIMNPCAHECIDTVGGYKCLCRKGWKLAADGFSCVDVDECAEKIDTCDREKKISTCKNTEGSFECICNRAMGYQQNEAHLLHEAHCVNFNECEDNPYICGGPDTCCLDLPPPKRYACNLPMSRNTFVARAPFATALGMSAARAPTTSNVIINPLNPKSPENVLLSDPTGVAMNDFVTTTAASAKNAAVPSVSVAALMNDGCLDNAVKTVKWNWLQPEAQLLVLDCQKKCQVIVECNYFTFNSITMRCSTKSSLYDRMTFRSFSFVRGLISGPKFCRRTSIPGTSPHVFPSPKMMPRLDQLREGLFKRSLEEKRMKETSMEEREEATYLVEKEGENLEATENEKSSNGSSGGGGKEEMMVMKMNSKLKSSSDDDDDDDMEKEEEEVNDKSEYPLVLTEEDIRRLESTGESSIFVANEMSDVEMQMKMKEELHKMTNVYRNIQQSNTFLPSVALGFGTRRVVGGIGGGKKCQAPFKLASDLYKQKLFQQLVKSVKYAIRSSGVSPDGSITRVTPEIISDSIIKNTNGIANGLANWYKEMVRVPGEVMEATMNATSFIAPDFLELDLPSSSVADFDNFYYPAVSGYFPPPPPPPPSIGTDRFTSAYTNRNFNIPASPFTPQSPPSIGTDRFTSAYTNRNFNIPASPFTPQSLYVSSSPMSPIYAVGQT